MQGGDWDSVSPASHRGASAVDSALAPLLGDHVAGTPILGRGAPVGILFLTAVSKLPAHLSQAVVLSWRGFAGHYWVRV